MPDIVVTVPKTFGLAEWIAEGDAAGDQYSGALWDFSTGGATPNIKPGERVYVVCHDRVRGYAPLVEWRRLDDFRLVFTRGWGAVAVTVPWVVKGFRGWRYRFWKLDEEIPFPEWRKP